MANYCIQYVPDEVIGGRDFVLCNKHTDGVVLYMRQGIRTLSNEENAAVWEDAWVAFRRLAHIGTIPPQRVYAGPQSLPNQPSRVLR